MSLTVIQQLELLMKKLLETQELLLDQVQQLREGQDELSEQVMNLAYFGSDVKEGE